MESFKENLKAEEERLEQISASVIKYALANGADECEVHIGGVKGLSVSSRDQEVENIEFNRDSGMGISIFKNKKSGSASVNDLSEKSLHEAVLSAINIAQYANVDECSGPCDKDLVCTDFKDLNLVFDNQVDADFAVKKAVELDQMAQDQKCEGIKKSDGTSFESYLYTNVVANSQGFCKATSKSSVYSGLTLLGESEGKMQRGSGFSSALSIEDMYSPQKILDEALTNTLEKLNSRKVATGKYNIIFTKSAVLSLWGHLSSAISGGMIYRKRSFLCDALGSRIFSDRLSIHEDPFVIKGNASRNYDSDGVRVSASDIISDGVLEQYLLSTYSSRKLKTRSNGHASGIHNWIIDFKGEKRSFKELLKDVGEGIVVTGLMGQGVDMVSGNYSRGAEGYYFKNGEFVHAVDGITIAGNLKDMFLNICAMADDVDERFKVKTGSLLIPNMAVSGA